MNANEIAEELQELTMEIYPMRDGDGYEVHFDRLPNRRTIYSIAFSHCPSREQAERAIQELAKSQIKLALLTKTN